MCKLNQANILNIKIMKRLLLILSAVCVLSFDALSICKSPDDEDATQVTLHGQPAVRPRTIMPAINCYYQSGQLYIIFDEEIEDCHVSVMDTNSGNVFCQEFQYSSMISLEVPRSAGEYYVELEVGSLLFYGYYSLY